MPKQLPEQVVKYLHGRGYTDELLSKELVSFVEEGTLRIHGAPVAKLKGHLVWTVLSAAGTIAGAQTREMTTGNYRWFQAPGSAHLPILYGSNHDFDTFYSTGSLVLAEGIFDRVALKRSLPDRAVFARLSKGVGRQLNAFIRRYGTGTIFLAFDNDDAGEKGTQSARQMLEGLRVERIMLPLKDPSRSFEKMPARTMELVRNQVAALE